MSKIPKHPSISVRVPQRTIAAAVSSAVATPKQTTSNDSAISNDYDNRIGQRVIIPTLHNLTGTLRFVGSVDFKPGIWAGVELDKEGAGKNDGSAQGKRYFQCPPNTGIFISVSKIVIHASPANTAATTTNSCSSSTGSHGNSSTTKPSPSSTTSSTIITRRSNLPLTKKQSTTTTSSAPGLIRPRYTSKTPTQTSSHASVIPTTNGAAKRSRIRMIRQSTTPSTSTTKANSRPSQSPSSYSHRIHSSSPTTASHTTVTYKKSTPTPNSSTPNNRRSVVGTPHSISTTSTTSPIAKRASSTPQLRSTTTTPKPVLLQKANMIPIASSPTEDTLSMTTKSDALSAAEADTLYDMLEKIQQERDTLLSQMSKKETAWERLVSIKESLSLQVDEQTSQNQHLSQQLAAAQSQISELQLHLTECEESLAQTHRDEEQQSYQLKRMTRLENLVRELQEEVKQKDEHQLELNRQHAGQLELVRKEVKEREAQCVSLEKECEELRRAGLEAIQAYDQSVGQLKQEHTMVLQKKNYRIQQLEYMVADLKHKQSTLFHHDDDDDLANLYSGGGGAGEREEKRKKEFEAKLLEIQQTSFGDEQHAQQLQQLQQPVTLPNGTVVGTEGQEEFYNGDEETIDQRHRLEEQLNLAMMELDNERRTIETLHHETEQLKLELQQSHQQTRALEEKYDQLQQDFEKELNDKKRLMEEADDAFEAHAKAEDEHYQMKLSTMKMEKDYQQLLEAHQRLEQNYNELMDEMLALEKQNLDQDASHNNNSNSNSSKNDNRQEKTTVENNYTDSNLLQKKIIELETEKETYQRKLETEKQRVQQLSKDLAELESLVENRVFGEADLEEKLETEKKKVQHLEKELALIKEDKINVTNRSNNNQSHHSMLMSPTTTAHTMSPTPTSSTHPSSSKHDDDGDKYCELCDTYGHDVLECKSDLHLSENGKLFCENCDDYVGHSSVDCPNQDEIF
ncbi:hypothetical protein BDF20DRAFT_895577 [Mycotypha africana]|uniref:uncharacterized protein n=1 Tax=Mycotypha africana TaxID=64632 RepID=UPI002300ED02|nr:uncharacterized protein BDF20DRAFT_895577 [Mycotypha africana]KAI8968305.1 hypothetical protein BDF20DRAFT_895577 [Mycotypha africana]